MDIEIELKLLATPSAQQDISSWLMQSAINYTDSAGKQLRNDYFETPQRTLRKHDIGLRIRGCNGEFEQTIKTKGRVVAGMHHRPEYNVPIASPDLQLTLFDPRIWPESVSIVMLEKELYLMFSTDFFRDTFLLTLTDGSQIELVIDIGSVSAGGRNLDICEVELELKSGSAGAIFYIAKQLADITPLRFGLQSKAARGYRLADNLQQEHYQAPENFTVNAGLSIIQNALSGLEQAFAVWQQGEAAFYQSQSIDDWRTMTAGMRLVQGSLDLYQAQFASSLGQEISSLSEQVAHLLHQQQEVDLYIQALNLTESSFLADAPQASVLKAELVRLVASSDLLTKLNELLTDRQYMQLQLSIGALLVEGVNAHITDDSDLKSFVHRTLRHLDSHSENECNKLAVCKVLWLELKLPKLLDCPVAPWSVLRQEDQTSLSAGLIALLKQGELALTPEISEKVRIWCTKI
ncbi:CYTH domain-containing protein [Paraglaciecola polaris]|uniref:Adenylate cyclase n=1 Tax=Paraglaciecola polaris LMG 21857 TaxID=1129793 RepID=K7A8M3_9ALTE|nr:CYTH domain-containing protein [Paraglaciecola polaris]GAC31775.1 adenylate cyclase [Paraglaciecola polaris LMG 21857]